MSIKSRSKQTERQRLYTKGELPLRIRIVCNNGQLNAQFSGEYTISPCGCVNRVNQKVKGKSARRIAKQNRRIKREEAA